MRKSLLYFAVIFVGLIFISRLFYLQVYSNKEYDIFEDNAIRKVFTYPKRGYIYDRNEKLLVSNQPSYDVMIIPITNKEFDKFVNCVDNILTYGCKYIDQTTDDILEKCNQSKLQGAAKIIKECRRIVNNTSRIRPTRLKWWEIYHNNK